MGRTSTAPAAASAVALLAAAGAADAEMYAIPVRRIDRDLHKTDDGVYIQTRYCYDDHAARGYEPYAYDERFVFEKDETRAVRVFK